MFLQTLTQLLDEKGITKSDFARQSGIPYTTLDGWYKKSFDGIRLETLLRIARFFDVSVDFLLNGASDQLTLEESRMIGKYRKLDRHGKRITDYVVDEELRRLATDQHEKLTYSSNSEEVKMIPLYLTCAAVGSAAPIEGDDFEMIELSPKVPRRAQFAVKISGDSMEPMISDGDVVYCSKDGVSMSDGDVGIFCVDGAYYCKQYRTDGDNMYLVSINRNRSDSDITIWGSGNRRATFIGKVLQF
ncbi:MAG: helix-turn-helix domain-containing protein [Oscillospiraceae bacterium]|jgi:repressor LexA|nr:helix-turn-helix domain-containing protein [Oscillospiraceae bacterium]